VCSSDLRLPTGKMSSRTGDNILYSEFMKEIMDYAKEQIKKRYADIKEKELEERALRICISAIKYSMLKQDAHKTIIFSKEEALEFEGNTGPYLLYSYARANSIIKKVIKKQKKMEIVDLKEQEIKLIKELGDFPQIVRKAYEQLAPNLIANYAFDLSQSFNEFYHSCPVLGNKEESFRLKLVESFRIVLKSSLNLLGIQEINEM
jgi:arginyl-tRNA synthetase